MSFIDALRAPRYTGERRCWPCTVVNLVLVGAAAVTFAVAGRAFAGAAVGIVGALAIWLRGYVVPFTPRFAPRLVAATPGATRVFEHASDDEGGPDEVDRAGDGTLAPGDVDGEVVLGRLVDAGVVVPDGDGLELNDAFRADWEARVRDVRDESIEDVAAAAARALPDASVSVEGEDAGRGPYVVVSRGDAPRLEDPWLTKPEAVAEVAAVDALEGYGFDDATRVAAAGPLRLFLETCPACGGAVVETTTVECCGGTAGAGASPDAVLACSDCDRRLFTLPE